MPTYRAIVSTVQQASAAVALAAGRRLAALAADNARALCIVGLLFFMGVLRNVHLPGIYMDAVNPDYLAAKILAGDRESINHFPPWGAFPFIGQLYHGVLHAYVGLFMFKLLGMSVFSLRLTQALFGFGIAVFCYLFLWRATHSRRIALLATALLSLDPSFLQAFRTQNYITLSPLVFVLPAAGLLFGLPDREAGSSWWRPVLVSGVLAGVAFYGYFIHLFFVPAFVILLLWSARSPGQGLRAMLVWGCGFLLGASLYFVGYARVLLLPDGLHELLQGLGGLKVMGTQIGLGEKLQLLWRHWVASHTGDLQFSSMTGELAPRAGGIKLTLLSFVVAGGVVLSLAGRIPSRLPWVLLFMGSFMACALVLASRLGPHHLIPLLPLLYLAFGLSLDVWARALSSAPWRRVLRMGVIAGSAVVVAGANLAYQNQLQRQLLRTGGVGYFTDALTAFAEDALRRPRATYYVLADWGFNTSFAFLTEGRVGHVPALDAHVVRQVACDVDLVFAFWGSGNGRIESFAADFGGASERRAYHRRDGALAFTAMTISERKNCRATTPR